MRTPLLLVLALALCGRIVASEPDEQTQKRIAELKEGLKAKAPGDRIKAAEEL
jgi:hypothetical protein